MQMLTSLWNLSRRGAFSGMEVRVGRNPNKWGTECVNKQAKGPRMSGAQGVIQHDQTTVSQAGE